MYEKYKQCIEYANNSHEVNEPKFKFLLDSTSFMYNSFGNGMNTVLDILFVTITLVLSMTHNYKLGN